MTTPVGTLASPPEVGPRFRSAASLPLGSDTFDIGTRSVWLAVPVRSETAERKIREHGFAPPEKPLAGLLWAILEINGVGGPTLKADAERLLNEVSTPTKVTFCDATTGARVAEVGHLGERTSAYFAMPDPPGTSHGNGVVGHFDDPRWLPKDRLTILRQRIFAALDVLLPFFMDDGLPWTEAATTAAGEVRDFFPVAAEPGLWPYYKAEGKEFFTWVERRAPGAKVPLPWETAAK